MSTLHLTFLSKWKQYFPGTELPLVLLYSDDERYRELVCALGFTHHQSTTFPRSREPLL